VERPTSVSVIGWTFIVLGGLSLVSGSLALFLLLSKDVGPAPWQILLQGVVAGAALIGGVYFLKGNRTARYVLEAIAWLALVALVWFYSGISPQLSSDPAGIAVVVLNFLVMVVPLVLILYFIRKRKVMEYLNITSSSRRTP